MDKIGSTEEILEGQSLLKLHKFKEGLKGPFAAEYLRETQYFTYRKGLFLQKSRAENIRDVTL